MATLPTLTPAPPAAYAALPVQPTTPVSTASGKVNPISQAANRWHVPTEILWGVYGMETTFGKNIATSSAGAQGAFQFIPGTAAQYGYPLTNTPTQQQFNQQADSAAHYLHDLYVRYGSWDAAIRGYGGGYGYAEVHKQVADNPGLLSGHAGNIPGPTFFEGLAAGKTGDVIAGAADALSAPLQLVKLLTSLEFWLRLGEGVAGLILIAMGLKALTGVTIPLPPVVPV